MQMIREIKNHVQKDKYLINNPIKSNDFSDNSLNSFSGLEYFIIVLFSIHYLVTLYIVIAIVTNEIKTEIDDIR